MLISPNLIDNFFKLISASDLPIAITILPQLGSSPAIAVFTKGEFAIENAIFFACDSVFDLRIFTVINLEDPSPSATTLLARFNNFNSYEFRCTLSISHYPLS